jgi:hypothetical protein
MMTIVFNCSSVSVYGRRRKRAFSYHKEQELFLSSVAGTVSYFVSCRGRSVCTLRWTEDSRSGTPKAETFDVSRSRKLCDSICHIAPMSVWAECLQRLS